MINERRIAPSVSLLFLAAVVLSAKDRTAATRLPTTREVPDAFGTVAYTVTTISATAFYPHVETDCGPLCIGDYFISGSLGRRGILNGVTEFYANLDLPGGAVIDYIGLNSLTDADFAYGVSLIRRGSDGSLTPVGSISSSPHGWDTDFNADAIGYVWDGRTGEGLVLNVEQGSEPNFEWFGWVEVWWRRSVSPPPSTASFNDVPQGHPFFQSVEALKASGITGGCSASPPRFCPDNPLTRGQMAVFLSKALGLNWPAEAGTTYTVTTVPATAFYPASNSEGGRGYYDTAGDLSRFSTDPYDYEDYYDSLEIPGGAIIDYIGLNSMTDTTAALGAELLKRHKDGGLTSIGSLSSTVHGFDTDFNPTPLGYVWPGRTGDALILHIQAAPNPDPQFFGWIEIWWTPSVSPAPAAATFNDVPTTHPFFRFVEALAASGITGGCSANPPLYCPDSSLTRGQMAVFLAKALGLHWPGN